MTDNENRNSDEPAGEVQQQVVGRDSRGRFGPGNSGRPKGLRFKATRAAEVLLDGELESLTRKCIEFAALGDMVAMRLVLERALPPRRSRPVQFEMPTLKTAADAPLAMIAIVEATAAGELTPDEAEIFTRLVEGFTRITELADLERRVRELEAAAKS